MKGQSSLEYLITYGWMLLAVAIVSGVAFTNFQSSCQRSFNGFYTDTLSMQQFGLNGSGGLRMSIKNQEYTELKIRSINITTDDANRFKIFNTSIGPGEDVSLGIPGFSMSETCNELELRMEYDKPPLKSQKIQGIMRAPLEIAN